MKSILVKNSLYSLLQTVLYIVLISFTIPVFIKLLGGEYYSIFSLVMIIGNLNTFTSLGLTNALVKFIAEQGKTIESNIDIWVNLIIIVIISLPITLLAVYFNKFILFDILKIPLKYYNETKWLYLWVLSSNFIILIGQTYKSVLDGLQKIYITSLQQVVYNLLYWGFILTVILLRYGLPEVGFSIFCSSLLWFAITLKSVFKNWGIPSFAGFQDNFKLSAKKQLSYGFKIYAGGLISLLYEPLSKILISNYIGILEVGFYDIAIKIKSILSGLVSKLFYPLVPFISVQKDKLLIRKYIHDLEQKTFLIIMPAVAIIILLMHTVITIWIGDNIEVISNSAVILTASYLMFSVTVIPNYQYLITKDYAHKTIFLQLANSVVNVVVFFMLVRYIGYYSVILGNALGILSSFILSCYYQKKYLNSIIFDSLTQILKVLLTLIISIFIGYLFRVFLNEFILIKLIFIPMISVVVVLFCYKIFGLIKRDDIYRYLGSTNKYVISLAEKFRL